MIADIESDGSAVPLLALLRLAMEIQSISFMPTANAFGVARIVPAEGATK